MPEHDLEDFDDFDPEIDLSKMPGFDIPNLPVDLMAHVAALEKVLIWSSIATPEMLSAVVAKCRCDFDQQLAEMRTQSLDEKFTKKELRAYWKMRNHQDAIDNWK